MAAKLSSPRRLGRTTLALVVLTSLAPQLRSDAATGRLGQRCTRSQWGTTKDNLVCANTGKAFIWVSAGPSGGPSSAALPAPSTNPVPNICALITAGELASLERLASTSGGMPPRVTTRDYRECGPFVAGYRLSVARIGSASKDPNDVQDSDLIPVQGIGDFAGFRQADPNRVVFVFRKGSYRVVLFLRANGQLTSDGLAALESEVRLLAERLS